MDCGTSFRQFEYCQLCRLNHKKRRKHVYSKKHQEILRNILKKFGTKISAAKKTLFTPEVRDVGFEQGARFWCYYCAEEVDKHQNVETTTVLMAGLLAHIASTEHHENTVQFFWDNLLTDKKLKTNFLLTDGDLQIFKKASFLAVKKYQKSKEAERKKVAATITYSEFQRQNVHQSVAEKSQIAATNIGTLPGTSRQSDERIIGKRTVSAYAQGLACVQIQGDESEGNIFTGARPPWLQKEEQASTGGCIGPTMEDYQKHLERERKSKLPATRVGAKFDHSAKSSENWLPSFGRVWSKGRRLQSKLHFEKEWKSVSSAAITAPKKTVSNSIEDIDGSQLLYGDNSVPPVQQTENSAYEFKQNRNNETEYGTSTQLAIRNSFQSDSYENNSSQDATETNRFPPDVYSHIMPYKRKRKTESITGQESHLPGAETLSASQNISYKSANQVTPYKRKRVEATVSGALIQTPLLAFEKFKPNE